MKKKMKFWLELEKSDLDRKIRNYSKFRALVLLSAVLGFLVSLVWLGFNMLTTKIKLFDSAIVGLIDKIRTPFLVNSFSFITILGGDYFIGLLFLILVAFLVKKNRKKAALVTLFALVGSGLLGIFLREFFGRPRPSGCISSLLSQSCYSFPSGHVTWAFYFYGLLDYLIFRFLPISLKRFLLLTSVITLLVILVSLSRLFLGVHYPSDIMGGFFLGGAWLLLAIFLIDILYSEIK